MKKANLKSSPPKNNQNQKKKRNTIIHVELEPQAIERVAKRREKKIFEGLMA